MITCVKATRWYWRITFLMHYWVTLAPVRTIATSIFCSWILFIITIPRVFLYYERANYVRELFFFYLKTPRCKQYSLIFNFFLHFRTRFKQRKHHSNTKAKRTTECYARIWQSLLKNGVSIKENGLKERNWML